MDIKPILFAYFPGAGGKCLINCMYLSQGVVFGELDNQNYSYRYKRILQTVPEPGSSDIWQDVEIDNPIQGFDYYVPYNNSGKIRVPHYNLKSDLDKLSKLRGVVPIVAHGPKNVRLYKKIFPDATVIQLLSDTSFIDLAIGLKFPATPDSPTPGFDDVAYQEWLDEMEKVKCDFHIHDYNPLDNEYMTECFNFMINQFELRLEEFNWDMVKTYYTRYVNFHA